MKKTVCLAGLVMLASACSGEIDYDACGTIDATTVTVSAESSGRILSLGLEEGDKVAAGQVLGAIDSLQTHLQILELRQRMDGASSRMVDIARQSAPNQNQLKSLHHELERFTKLLDNNATTRKQVDDLNDKIAILKAQMDAQSQSWERNNASVRSEIRSYEIQLAQREDQLAKCRIIAPVAGTVLSRYAEAGESVTAGKPLFKVAELSRTYVRAYFSTAQLAGLKTGDKVTVIPDDGSKSPAKLEGRILWISDQAEFTPKNIQTRDERAGMVYAVKVAVPNDGSLRLGMYAYVKSHGQR